MAARLSIALAARRISSVAARRPSLIVSQKWQQVAPKQRLFSVSAALKEKRYTEDHEWIELSADGKTCTLGISEYAAKALGDVVYIELPQVDMEVAEGDVIGAVESVKSASDILTPIAGVVSEVNEALETAPGSVNKDPEGDAWVAKIAVSAEPKGKTMSKEEYATFTEE
ncbi:hypothetical protein COCMIDRAFT_22528 [Bipolaris oryzae ATCC 44560]|uniref:Glycine cleavage system H protein n=1 Tax=Bipolaris oryzae ATCC 44560 TaxID=930090 RepID=W6ZIX8_COCMI|nr:uncharacterized protein COCMIDRAFT_22528 [Bipolaris oryzae ATCC 44560]EUC49975.1 hypothetical protein COCMIDRAFT_22528 [Bipolaris oryzae ATCC 44560]